MVFKRPLLFLSLPSLALVLGLVWFRRKRSIDCDTGGENKSKIVDSDRLSATPSLKAANKNSNCKHSKSMKIDNNTRETELLDKLGKSAPIDIVPNSKSPPYKIKTTTTAVDGSVQNDCIVDPEILNSKIKDTDLKTLKSIEEQEDFESISPIDLPDSGERRRFVYLAKAPVEEPVIVKASMAAKISPKNSFAETKYTEECCEDDRDSANHSPVNDVHHHNSHTETTTMIELNEEPRNPPVSSPPLSLCSLRSNDSGKGSSPPHSIAGTPQVTYDFSLPQNLVGQVIGRKGTYVSLIKQKTGATVQVRKHPETNKMKICSIRGTQTEIDAALKMIRNKLPESHYPNLTMARVFFTTPETILPLPTLDTTCLRLQLIEGINNDVIISSVISGGHVFFQQPLHPSFPSLNTLQNCMRQCYSLEGSPPLPDIKEDVICVAPIAGDWYRVQIIAHNPETQSCLVKYLDYGGYTSVLGSDLRQIRTDFMTVSLQAIECLLSNIRPIGGGTEWVPEAAEVLQQLTKGIIMQAQVAGYSSDGLPEVFLYACLASDNVIFINQELVARGLAEWTEDVQ